MTPCLRLYWIWRGVGGSRGGRGGIGGLLLIIFGGGGGGFLGLYR